MELITTIEINMSINVCIDVDYNSNGIKSKNELKQCRNDILLIITTTNNN